MNIKMLLSVILLLYISLPLQAQKFEDLAKTPPMGWNSWGKFGCDISEKLIKEIADSMATNGMRDAGYNYVIVDDCWQVARDSIGNILCDKERFPSGIKALAEYVHARGLKFGIYTSAGYLTCEKRPGSRGYQFQDARTYARWGVDYLKYDYCNVDDENPRAAYKTISDALKASGRSIILSISDCGVSRPWEWGKGIGHLWRTSIDIINCFQGNNYWGGLGVLDIIDHEADLYSYAGPGHWNDPDMLHVGNGGMTNEECKTHFSMWCMLAAPLLAGNDIRNMDKASAAILLNKEVIAVDQDPEGIQARRYLKLADHEIWVKQLANGEVSVCFLNRDKETWSLDFDWTKENMMFAGINLKTETYNIRDLWLHAHIGRTDQKLKKEISSHGVLMVRLSRKQE